MPLLLTSAGFPNPHVGAVFASHLKDPATARILFFSDAARTEHERTYVRACLVELRDLGCGDLRERTMDTVFTPHEFSEADVVYVAGGNTFHLLRKMRECRFKEALLPFLDRGGLYVGVSAGSIVPGPDIAIAGFGSEGDENDAGMTDLTGLGVVDFTVFPHFTPELRAEAAAFREQANYDVLTLTDEQAVLVEGRKRTIIG